MKAIITLLVSLLILANVNAQVDLLGRWKINTLVGLTETNEYRLTRSDEIHIYGNSINLDSNHSFYSSYSAWCGLDCFTTNMGSYEILDGTHIRFFLERVEVIGHCEHQKLYPNKEVGTFFIVEDSTGVRLIRSSMDQTVDRKNRKYSDQIDEMDLNTSHHFNLSGLDFKPTDGADDLAIVKDGLLGREQFDTSKVKVLFSKNIRGDYFRIILFKHKRKTYHMVYELRRKNIALFELDKIP